MEDDTELYHIAYYSTPTSTILNCCNFECKTMIEALKQFKKEYPDIEPLYIHHKK